MSKKHYEYAKQAKLAEYFTPFNFRLIPSSVREMPHGISEIPIEIDIEKKFAKSLSYSTPWDGTIYGFVNNKKILLQKINKTEIKKISITDWEGSFGIIFESNDGKEDPVLIVSPEEVRTLLENCLKPINFED
ncbi:MAG: hypothetical protein ACI4RC_03470 [Oscillospiraceae bacterium]